MAKLEGASPDRMADYFVDYLFKRYPGRRHVRRVAAWVGLIVLGISRLAGVNWKVSYSRQLAFQYGGKTFKGRYNHKAGPRGGIEIVETGSDRVVASITGLEDAERFYSDAGAIL